LPLSKAGKAWIGEGGMDAVIITTLIGWIAANSNLVAAEPPHITFVPKHEMRELYYGAKKANEFFRVQAFYLPDKTTIVLPATWRASELRDRSVLLHELVHHLQKSNNIKAPCPAVWERQAYNLQFAWLREQGVEDPYEFIETNVLTVIMLTACAE
jgi:hypothetical protein